MITFKYYKGGIDRNTEEGVIFYIKDDTFEVNFGTSPVKYYDPEADPDFIDAYFKSVIELIQNDEYRFLDPMHFGWTEEE